MVLLETSSRLKITFTPKFKPNVIFLFGLIILRSMRYGMLNVEDCSDSLLVEQVAGEFQCLEESLKVCLDACLDIIGSFAEFQIRHIPRHENQKANM
jgi:hypothetical protein